MYACNSNRTHYFTCDIAKDCGKLAAPTNGDITVTSSLFLGTANYSCKPGYDLVGEESRTCTASGSWNSTIPSCKGEYEFAKLTGIRFILIGNLAIYFAYHHTISIL